MDNLFVNPYLDGGRSFSVKKYRRCVVQTVFRREISDRDSKSVLQRFRKKDTTYFLKRKLFHSFEKSKKVSKISLCITENSS